MNLQSFLYFAAGSKKKNLIRGKVGLSKAQSFCLIKGGKEGKRVIKPRTFSEKSVSKGNNGTKIESRR